MTSATTQFDGTDPEEDMEPSITAIAPGRRRGRFNIAVDGMFAVAVSEKVIADLGLRVGQSFTADRLKQVADAEEQRRAVESAVRLLETRHRSAGEIEQRLRQKGYEGDVIAGAVATLRRLELIDDAEFAKQWVESRARARPKGARLLRSELAQKGVAREEIDIAVEAVAASGGEADLARKALAGKLPRAGLPEDNDARRTEYRRLASFLQRRGFGWDSVKAALDEAFGRGGVDESSETDS